MKLTPATFALIALGCFFQGSSTLPCDTTTLAATTAAPTTTAAPPCNNQPTTTTQAPTTTAAACNKNDQPTTTAAPTTTMTTEMPRPSVAELPSYAKSFLDLFDQANGYICNGNITATFGNLPDAEACANACYSSSIVNGTICDGFIYHTENCPTASKICKLLENCPQEIPNTDKTTLFYWKNV